MIIFSCSASASTGFNRYIVECKLCFSFIKARMDKDLIDT